MTVVFNDGAGVSAYDVRSRQVTKLTTTVLTDVVAGGGRWAGWRRFEVVVSDGARIAEAGAPAMNRDGILGYVTPRQTTPRQVVVDGRVLDTCVCAELSLSRTLAAWV